jgi:hypothetical protein
MSHPISEPARQQRVNRALVSRTGLFSHTPEAEACEQRHRLAGDDADWRATPFSGEIGEPHRGVDADRQD